MSNVSGIGDAYYWSVFKIAEAFGLHRDTVKNGSSQSTLLWLRLSGGTPFTPCSMSGPPCLV